MIHRIDLIVEEYLINLNCKVIDFFIANQQAKQMDDDCAAIMSRGKFIAPGEEGLRDIRVVEAVYRSAATRGLVTI